MDARYGVALFGAFCFMMWAHLHTDEIPVVFAFLAAIGFALGAAVPGRFVWSWIAPAMGIPGAEMLVHYSLARAPYHGSALPTIAAIAGVSLVPSLAGVALGRGLRRAVRHDGKSFE